MKPPAFSWKQAKLNAIDVKIRRARTMANKKNSNPDFAINHPDWIRDAQNKNYTVMDKKIKEMVEKQQKQAIERRLKFARKT